MAVNVLRRPRSWLVRAPASAHPNLRLPEVRIRRTRLDAGGLFGVVVLATFVTLALSADVLAAYLFQRGPLEQNLLQAYARPTLATPAFWLGADELGRSQVVRLLYAARVSLAVGFGATLITLTLGVTVGLIAGYFRGAIDDLIQALVSTTRSVPTLFFLLLIAVLFEPGVPVLVLVLGLLAWPSVALFVRGQTLSLREREFVTAAQSVGASHCWLIVRHILPNVLPLTVVLAAIDVSGVILAESSLSFLGLGVSPPTPSWGNMLTNAAASLSRGPWLVWGPGCAIFLTVLALYLIGDALRDAMDPRR